jgi:hypothetical protein
VGVRNNKNMKSLKTFSGKGKANTALSVSTEKGARYLVHQVVVSYSANPTQTGVVVSLDSGLGADYDADLLTGTANVRYTIFPEDLLKPFIVMENDILTVTAPAGGAGITSAISILAEKL